MLTFICFFNNQKFPNILPMLGGLTNFKFNLCIQKNTKIYALKLSRN